MRRGARPVDLVDNDRVLTRLPLIAGTVSYLHIDVQDTDLAAPGRSGP